MDNLALSLGQLSPALKMLFNERGEVAIPFIESVEESQRPAVETFISNSGATEEQLASYSNFGEFLQGYKPDFSGNASWKSNLSSDMRANPLITKFADTPEGLSKVMESHVGLEQLLGHEKVPIPKNADDVEGWNRLSKALGVPDKAEEYGLADVDVPEGMKGLAFNKKEFADVIHSFKLTPNQAKGLWSAYSEMSKNAYVKFQKEHQDNLQTVVNQLRSEWGDQYDVNVDLGQLVINKFSADQDMQDYLTSILSKDPRGIKFLAKLGNQFAENQMGDFKIKRFSMSADEASAEYNKILADTNHPYTNSKSTPDEHNAAVTYVNRLIEVIERGKG